MSAVSDDAAATSWLLSEVEFTLFRCSSDVQATSSFCYYLTPNLVADCYLVRPTKVLSLCYGWWSEENSSVEDQALIRTGTILTSRFQWNYLSCLLLTTNLWRELTWFCACIEICSHQVHVCSCIEMWWLLQSLFIVCQWYYPRHVSTICSVVSPAVYQCHYRTHFVPTYVCVWTMVWCLVSCPPLWRLDTTSTYVDGGSTWAPCATRTSLHDLSTCAVSSWEFCHLPVTLAELAVKAFDVDSHANSVSAKSAIGHFKEPQLTPQIKTKLNEILEKCGVPLIGEPNIIEGTLSCW